MSSKQLVKPNIPWLNIFFMSGEQITNTTVNNGIKSKMKRKVDINVLLNKVRVEEKKEKFENTVFFGLIAAVILVTGVIVSF